MGEHAILLGGKPGSSYRGEVPESENPENSENPSLGCRRRSTAVRRLESIYIHKAFPRGPGCPSREGFS